MTSRRLLGLPLLAAAALIGRQAAAGPDAPAIRVADEPPPGFEAFFQRQETIVDVYYAGRFLASARASYDVDDLRFDDPLAIVTRIPDLIDPARVADALTGDLPTHAALLCGRTVSEDCGRLEPEIAGVVFDASRFRAELFLAPSEIETSRPEIDRFLPASDARFSVLQNVSAAYSGADDGEDAMTVQSVTSLSWGETHLQMEGALNDGNELNVDALMLRREYRGRSAQGGLFRTRGQSLGFVADRDLLGLRLGSSLQTRADRAFSNGSPLAVFLPERSRVEILQDGRLLGSGAYEAGNQILDTSTLPEGAYEVVLRIREIGGRERIERRFFVKTTRIPPQDQPLWSVEFGRTVDRTTEEVLPEDTGEWFGRVSYTRRFTAAMGIDVGASATAGSTIGELGLYRIDRFTEAQASVFAGNGGTHGAAGFGRLRAGTVAATLDWRVVRGLGETAVDPLLGSRLEQVGLNLSTGFAGGRLALNARYDERGGDSTSSQGITYDRYASRGRASGFRLSFDVGRQDGDWFGFSSIQYDFRGRGFFGDLEPGLRYDEQGGASEFGPQARGRLSWERARSRNDLVRLGMSGITGNTENRLGADALLEGRSGVVAGQVDRDFDGAGRTTWTGRLNTSLLSDGRSVSVGGRDRSRAAALIAIAGDVPDARFEVLVDGFPQGTARAGTVTPIHLRPWESYEVRLRPVGDALLAWENRERTITLYPGNVVRLEWEVAEVVVLFGRILDADGSPVENARIDGAYGFAMTETAGLFQAQVLKPERPDQAIRLEVEDRSGRTCSVDVDLQTLTPRRGIYRVGSRRCD
ncbi:MAG: CS1-pili formation C-terminal domain-containing protein [Pseudomonadales bacterium]|jgi:hypothetical protein|nr:CS1-pili formation C-terminal domain-containing protein [Pseudomonadales bacterium]